MGKWDDEGVDKCRTSMVRNDGNRTRPREQVPQTTHRQDYHSQPQPIASREYRENHENVQYALQPDYNRRNAPDFQRPPVAARTYRENPGQVPYSQGPPQMSNNYTSNQYQPQHRNQGDGRNFPQHSNSYMPSHNPPAINGNYPNHNQPIHRPQPQYSQYQPRNDAPPPMAPIQNIRNQVNNYPPRNNNQQLVNVAPLCPPESSTSIARVPRNFLMVGYNHRSTPAERQQSTYSICLKNPTHAFKVDQISEHEARCKGQ